MTPITHVRHVALAVPDFETERAFLGGLWGLTEVEGEDGVAWFAARASTEPFLIRLRRSQDRRTDLYAFAADSREGVQALHDGLAAKGVRIAAAPRALASPGGGFGFRFFDLDGRLVEVSADVAPRSPEPPPPKSAVPKGLSHAVFHTPDVKATVGWYETMLGMRVSDWLAEGMCFLRGASAKHHCIAFLNGPPVLNHVAFDMVDADEMMRGLGRMLKHDIPLTWGPGRHVAGDNTFAYFVSPAGNILEYTAELETLPDDWTPRVLPRTPEMMDQWGTGRITGPAVPLKLAPDPGLWTADTAG